MGDHVYQSSTPVEIRDLWRTPDYAFMPLDDEFDFALDAAAAHDNRLVPTAYLTKEIDALSVSWADHLCPMSRSRAVWLNPPYSSPKPWIRKAAQECRDNNLLVVMLVPNTPDAGWWPVDFSEVRIVTGAEGPGKRDISGRIQFLRADTGKPAGNQSKGSCYLIFAPGTMGNQVTKYVPITELKSKTEELKNNKEAA